MKRQMIMRALRKLADSRCNDAVKLAYLTEEDLDKIDELDLRGLVELKRSGNGGVELKLLNRLQVLEMLDRMNQRGREETLDNFLDDLKKGEET